MCQHLHTDPYFAPLALLFVVALDAVIKKTARGHRLCLWQ
jgi:hypothetical protein